MNIHDPKKIVDAVEQEVNIAFSDVALANDFADQNLKHLRFVPLMGKWFVWDGRRWEM